MNLHRRSVILIAQHAIPASLSGIARQEPDADKRAGALVALVTMEDGLLPPPLMTLNGCPPTDRGVLLPSVSWLGCQAKTNVVSVARSLMKQAAESRELLILCADTSPATVGFALGVAAIAPNDAHGVFVCFDMHVQPADQTSWDNGRPACASSGCGMEN